MGTWQMLQIVQKRVQKAEIFVDQDIEINMQTEGN